MKKIIIFASGSGSNAENIILYFQKKESVSIVAIFCNNKTATVLNKAKNLDVPTFVFEKEDLISGNILKKIKEYQPDLIVLAGFLLKFPKNIIEVYPYKIINIHPSLLPKYGGKGMYGIRVHEAVIANKETVSGITIHYVNENYDEGHIIFQKTIGLAIYDTPQSIAKKILTLEHDFFPKIIEQLLN